MKSSKTIFLETLRGKSIYRVLTNLYFNNMEFSGEILDIGGVKNKASHYRFMRIKEGTKIKTVDINKEASPDIVSNIEKEKLSLLDNSFDHVFAFNIIEHLSNPDNLLSEAKRVLKSGGSFVGVVPFLVNVHPDPNDYLRYTNQKLEEIFVQHGFSKIEISPIGRGPFIAGYSHTEFLFPAVLRIPFIFLALALDKLLKIINEKATSKNKFPLAYAFIVSK